MLQLSRRVMQLAFPITPFPLGLYAFPMVFCDVIVAMEQTQISPRPIVGAIIGVSGLAVSSLLWLLCVHHASVAGFRVLFRFLHQLYPCRSARNWWSRVLADGVTF